MVVLLLRELALEMAKGNPQSAPSTSRCGARLPALTLLDWLAISASDSLLRHSALLIKISPEYGILARYSCQQRLVRAH